MKLNYSNPEKLINSLKFYGTGDEGYELFIAGCRFAYQLYGIGNDKQLLNSILHWLVDYAIENKKWYYNQYGEFGEDYETECWGY